MENTVDALYMASAVLIFMLALTLTLSSFSTFRNQLEDIILQDERVDTVAITDSSGQTSYVNYITGSENGETRTVGIETIVNSLYRVYKENYQVVLKLKNYKDSSGKNYENDLKAKSIGTGYGRISEAAGLPSDNSMIIQATKKQLYKGQTIIENGDNILVFKLADMQNNENYINDALKAGLYDLLKDKTFTEYTGVYYEDDVGNSNENKPEGVSDVNKREARIITYIEK